MDAADGRPVGRSDTVLDADRRRHRPGGQAPGAGREFQRELLSTMVETASGVCTDLARLRGELTASRSRLAAAARKAGARPVACGTAPMAAPPRAVSPTPHYRQMARLYGRLTDETETCGCHVHVGVPDREAAVAVLNHLRPWLPVLLALSANSPFHQGADTGHASWRTLVLSRWPTHQVPPYFESAEHYDRTVTELRYAGVLPVRAANAYWFARPSAHLPTVEVRIADVTPSVDEAVLQAGLTRALVATALDAVSAGGGRRGCPSTRWAPPCGRPPATGCGARRAPAVGAARPGGRGGAGAARLGAPGIARHRGRGGAAGPHRGRPRPRHGRRPAAAAAGLRPVDAPAHRVTRGPGGHRAPPRGPAAPGRRCRRRRRRWRSGRRRRPAGPRRRPGAARRAPPRTRWRVPAEHAAGSRSSPSQAQGPVSRGAPGCTPAWYFGRRTVSFMPAPTPVSATRP